MTGGLDQSECGGGWHERYMKDYLVGVEIMHMLKKIRSGSYPHGGMLTLVRSKVK
jgi:hypothetical protein